MANRLVTFLVEVKDGATAVFEGMKNAIKGVGEQVISLKGLLVALVSGAIVKGIEGMVEAFAEQEQVTTRLNAALRVSGRFTQEASDQIQEMAARMRETTVHSDEEALGVSATFASMARELTATQLAEAQKLAIGFADATGRSVEGAASLIVRSLTGQGNALKRYGVDLDTSASQQEKFNEIQKKLGPLFAISQAEAQTLSGQIARAKNEFHEMQETMGEAIARFLGVNEKTNTLRETFIRWRKEIEEHAPVWIRYAHAVIAAFGVIGAAISAWVTVLVGIVSAVATTLFGGILAGFYGVKTAIYAVAESIVLIVSTALNKAFIEPLNALFEGIDFIASKFGKSFKVHLDAIDTSNAFANTREGAVQTGEVVSRIGAEWVDQFRIIKDSIQGVGDAMGRVSDQLNAPLTPLTGGRAAGAGANIGITEDMSDEEKLRRITEEQKLLDAERKAGAITLEQYVDANGSLERQLESLKESMVGNRDANDALYSQMVAKQKEYDAALHAGTMTEAEHTAATNKLKDAMTAQLTVVQGNRQQVIQLYAALAKVKDVRFDALLGQAEMLKLELSTGKKSAGEYDTAMKALVTQMEALLRAAGLTEDQIKKITKAMIDGKASTTGLGDAMKRAFGLDEGGGARAVASANAEVAKMSFGLANDFTSAIGEAIIAGGNLGKSVERAVGQAAKAFAKQAIGRSIMELAEGFAALAMHAPKEASEHFKAAATFGAAAVVMGGIGAALGGGGGGGGGGSAGSNAAAQAAGAAKKGSATITITGGLLDMTNPDQAESLRKAFAELSDRDVFIGTA